jgi:threonine dehydratase
MNRDAPDVSRESIERAYRAIHSYIRLTPVLAANGGELGLLAFPLTLKLELTQVSGSFKARGAFTHLLTRPIPSAGVVAASGGNHGAAVAYAAMRCGVAARIFVPTVSSPVKMHRIRGYGADLVVIGDRYADALAASEEWRAHSGALAVHAFDDAETLMGQGTIGLELTDQASTLDTVLVAVGGGGLIAGMAAWYSGSIRIVGVEPIDAPTLTRALAAGRPVDAPAGSIAADSLAPRRVGELVFPLAKKYVSEVILVDDDQIRLAQCALWEYFRVAAEPGGAAAFAALVGGAYKPSAGERVGVVISGGNTADVNFPATDIRPAPRLPT